MGGKMYQIIPESANVCKTLYYLICKQLCQIIFRLSENVASLSLFYVCKTSLMISSHAIKLFNYQESGKVIHQGVYFLNGIPQSQHR